MLFTGSISWHGQVDEAARRTENQFAFPFARLYEFNRSKYDAWITTLECPTSHKGIEEAPGEQVPARNCHPAYLPEFTKWFDVVSLANEHTDDMGSESFIRTRMALDRHRVQHLGHYDPDSMNACEVIALPVQVEYDDGATDENDLPVSICGYNFVGAMPSEAAIEQIAKHAARMPTIALPHGGAENASQPDPTTKQLYRKMIDKGADIVIGSHPQSVQGSEAYDEHLIVYSTGDFLSGEQSGSEASSSAAIKATMSISGEQAGEAEQWLNLSARCKKHNDSCLEAAEALSLIKPKASYDFDVVATSSLGYQPHPDSGSQQEVERRLNWPQTVQALPQK